MSSGLKKLGVIVALCVGSVVIGAVPPAGANDVAQTETGCAGYSDSVARLYSAAFLRPAEQAGFNYWMATYTSGRMSLTEIAEFFSGSAELQSLYGDLTDAEYVDRIYQNVLDRSPDAEGLAFWTGLMDGGMSRGTLLLRFTESPEFVTKTDTAEPTAGFYNNGLDDVWECIVDTSRIESVTSAFATAIADRNSTHVAILSGGEFIELNPVLPEFELGDPALFLNPENIDYPWCEPIGDFSRDCYWFLLEDGDITWTLRMIVSSEGIDFDGSGWTGRFIVTQYEVTRAG